MASEFGESSAKIASLVIQRRSVLRAAAVAGALAVTALPTLALADHDGKPGKRKGHHKGGWVDVDGTTAGGARFDGQMRFTNFQVVQGATNSVVANGVLKGQFKDASGKTIATLDGAGFTAPVSDINTGGTAPAGGFTAQAIPLPTGCTILNLVLGPLQLNLLGLVLTIPDVVTIDLTAVPGGGLLGDLLCAVANLLSGGLGGLLGNLPALTAFITALNNLINALNNL
jgi:hypothetical protein